MRITTLPQLERRIAQLEAKVNRLSPIANSPMQTPGSFETGRSNYKMGKRHQAELDRKMNAWRELKAAQDELTYLKARLAGYLAGECHINGQRRKDAPSRLKQKTINLSLADFLRAHIQPGDEVGLAMNPNNRITVKRVNAKSVTSDSGSKWSYDEIFLLGEDGKPLPDDVLRAKLKAWFEAKKAD